MERENRVNTGNSAASPPRAGRIKLFGPVLFYDLLRTARRGRFFLLRCGYAIFLLLTLFSVYGNFHEDVWSGSIRASQMAQFAESFFYTFMSIQFVVVALLTPAYVAGAVAEEKERKTLEFLLATDLRNQEIILSKLLSRLANMALLILTGLPILAMTQFLGGVDPALVLLSFGGTGMTMLGLASLSILSSVYARKPRNAIMQTYLVMVAYLCVTGLAFVMLEAFPQTKGQAIWFGDNPITSMDVADFVGIANPFLFALRFGKVVSPGLGGRDLMIQLFLEYGLFYTVMSLVCTSWAVLRLRAVALKQASGPDKKAARRIRRRKRAPVSDRPMVWKEVRVESGHKLGWAGRVAVVLLLVASFVPPAWMLAYYLDDILYRGASDRWLSIGVNVWVRLVGTAVACLTLLGVAFRASASITGERDKQTFDSLLTSPLDSSDILYGKWLGSILSARWGLAWLGLIWVVAMAMGGMHVLALPLLIVAWVIFAAFLAVVGLWFSTVSRTTMRANFWTLALTLGVTVGHWVPWITCCLPLQIAGGSSGDWEHVAKFQAMGLTPPITLGWLAFHGEEFDRGGQDELVELMADAIIGLILWAVATGVLWAITSRRFRRITNRLASIPQPTNPFADKVVDDAPAAEGAKIEGPAPPTQET